MRLTGEDCVRGTFTHRHAGMYDFKTGQAYFPLADLNPKAKLLVAESILSEYGVVGFEYGFSVRRSKIVGDVGSAIRRLREWSSNCSGSIHGCR